MASMLQNQEFTDELAGLVRDQNRREQRAAGDPDMDMSIYRSGSAPPTVEGSLNSIGGFFSDGNVGFMREDEVRADPGYVNYYYSNGNLNPRLPPPLLSKEDWRLTQRNRSQFAVRQGFDGGKEAYGRRSGGDWGGDELIGLRNGQKNIAEMIQDDLNQTTYGTRESSPGADNVGFLSATSVLGSSLSRKATLDKNTNFGFSASLDESIDLAPAFSRLNLSKNVAVDQERHFLHHSQRQILQPGCLQERGNGVARKTSLNSRHIDNFNSSVSNYAFDEYATDAPANFPIGSKFGNGNSPRVYENAALGGSLAFRPCLTGVATEVQNLSRLRNHAARNPFADNLSPSQAAALNEAVSERCYPGEAYMDFLQKAYLEALISQQKMQYYKFYGNSGLEFCSSRAQNMSSAFRPRNFSTGGSLDSNFGLSLLDQFKNNKTMNFELSEIVGHIVEFSGDQYGSRFIQQRLETATIEEINIVFNEIMPQAHTLITDVFGNYVVQKFLEHGTPCQIRQLGDKLMGNVLALSLQMYGCRVIQKALEVVELDQKTEMVKELDGHVMRCVRDQNGNHVIQKCIEYVPEDSIEFVVSTFYDQVLTLSTHPYGCRVMQRVLEHCRGEKTQGVVMDEIMRSVCMLAQDQYGNYVLQHVLEHGKPHERSAIIEKLTGQIVQMSQHKFASNVIEKCLAFGTPNQRKLLVNEMLGPTDENEHLQVMMKDQFGNYVVQKVLETCNDQQLELVFNRIKVHLNTLQKYTYGKHIVSRVEKLVAAGERRISTLTLNQS